MGWEKFANVENSTAGHVECESCIDSFFDMKGVVRHEFLPDGQTLNRWYYLEELQRTRESVWRKRPELWRNSRFPPPR